MKSFFYISLFALAAIILVSCERSGNRMPSLVATYAYNDAKPFGGKVAFDIAKQAFASNYIITKKESIYDWYNYSERRSVFISITDRFQLSEKDVTALLDFVHSGNTAFISSNYIDTLLLQRVNVAYHEMGFFELLFGQRMIDTYLKSAPDSASNKVKYSYFYKPMFNFFDSVDAGNHFTVSGTNYDGMPNAIVLKLEQGKLILHCEPNGLSNYFLLTKNNKDNFTNLLHQMQSVPEYVYWDNYYTDNYGGEESDGSLLSTLKKYPELYKAFLLSLLLLLIFILFGRKRTQRIIPVRKPVENSSIKFAEAIAGLYLRDNDHKSIAEKMTVYFFERIRNRYYINTNSINEEFIKTLSRKSGYAEDKTRALIKTIADISAKPKATAKDLVELNKQIENFNKHII